MKTSYQAPSLSVDLLSVERGIANSVFGFSADSNGNVQGDTNSADNGYSSFDNGNY